MLEFFYANAYIPDFNSPNSLVIIKHDYPNQSQQYCGDTANYNPLRFCSLTDTDRKYLIEKDKEKSCDKCCCWSSFSDRLMKFDFINIQFASSNLKNSSTHGYICNLPHRFNDTNVK